MLEIVNVRSMLTNVNIMDMLMIVNITTMPKTINAATVGALVRDARTAAGLTQTELANRIGASRFWVAEFEKGKPSVALGLALKALHALGLTVAIESKSTVQEARSTPLFAVAGRGDLARVIAHATLTSAAPSKIVGWPTASASPRRSRKS